MNIYFCYGKTSQTDNKKLVIAFSTIEEPIPKIIKFHTKFELNSLSRQALTLFKLLSYIEEKKHKEVTIYHATTLFPLNPSEHPQISSLVNKLKRMKKIGYKLSFVHAYEFQKENPSSEKGEIWKETRKAATKAGIKKETKSIRHVKKIEKNKTVKREIKKKCFCCKKEKIKTDFPYKKGSSVPKLWCQTCEDSFIKNDTLPLCDAGGTYRKALKREEMLLLIEKEIVIKTHDIYRYKNKEMQNLHTKKITLPSIQQKRLEEIKSSIENKYQNKVALIDNHNLVCDYISKRKANKLIQQGFCVQKSSTSIQWVENKIKQEIHPLNYFNIKQTHQSTLKNGIDFILPISLKNTICLHDRDNQFCFRISKNIGRKLVEEGVAVYLDILKNNIRLLYDQFDFNQYVKKRDRHKCIYCEKKGDTVEHLVARFHGGLTTLENCACACEKCNSSKGNKTIEDYLRERQTKTV